MEVELHGEGVLFLISIVDTLLKDLLSTPLADHLSLPFHDGFVGKVFVDKPWQR